MEDDVKLIPADLHKLQRIMEALAKEFDATRITIEHYTNGNAGGWWLEWSNTKDMTINSARDATLEKTYDKARSRAAGAK